jgi:hypothetical protein
MIEWVFLLVFDKGTFLSKFSIKKVIIYSSDKWLDGWEGEVRIEVGTLNLNMANVGLEAALVSYILNVILNAIQCCPIV